MLPVAVVLVMFVTLLAVGPRLPRWALALLGPAGVALIAYALATSPGPGDGAILYALPVLWTTIFFGRRGAFAIVACVGVGEATALLLLPAASTYPARWVDVMVSTTAIAIVAHVLECRSEILLERLRGEARTDPLTSLLNRRGFDEHAARELAHAGRDGRPIALAIFDIDHFVLWTATPEGVEVVLSALVYAKILEEHASVADLGLIDRTIRRPDGRRADVRTGSGSSGATVASGFGGG